jgi:hypothetical protein
MNRLKRAAILALFSLAATSRAQDREVGGIVLEDHTGTPVASAVVRVSRPIGGILKEAETDRDGRFVLGSLAAGDYEITITRPNYVRLIANFSTKLAISPVFRLVRYGVISGHVPGASSGVVVAYEKVPPGIIPRTYRSTVGSTGEYRIFDIPPGRYILGMLNMNLGPGMRRGQTMDAQREFAFMGGEDYARVSLPPPQGQASAIGGRVENPQTHSILLASPDYPAVQSVIMLSRADGTFRFENVLPGKYDLTATSMPGSDGAPALHGRVQVEVYGQAAEDVLIPMRATPPVNFVLDETLCSAEVTLTLTPLDRVAGGRPVVVSSAAGMPITVAGLAPAQYQVATATRDQKCLGTPLTTVDLTRSAPQAPVVIKLYPPGSIHGKLESAGPMIANVVLRDLGPARESPTRVQFVRSGAAFIFDNLPPGNYCVLAQTAGSRGDCAHSSFVLSPGETKMIGIPITAN